MTENYNKRYYNINLLTSIHTSYGKINLCDLQDNNLYRDTLLSNFGIQESTKDCNDQSPKVFLKEHMITKKILTYFFKSKENMKFLDINDNKMYDLFNICTLYNGNVYTILYYFNKDRPFIIIQGYIYGLLIYYYDIYSMNLIILNYHKNGAEDFYYYEKNDIFLNAINNKYSIIYSKKIEKKYLMYGYINYVGHQDIELYGLSYLLDNINSLEEYTDTIVIGYNDIYNMISYFKSEYSNLNIITYKEFTEINDGIPFYFTSYPACDKSRNIIAKIDSLQYTNNNVIKYIENYRNIELVKDNVIEITFDIRTNRRKLYNIIDFYVYIINNLLNDFPNYIIKIFFTGYINNFNEHDLSEQNNIANNIINSFTNNNLIFMNLIGKPYHNVLNNIINNDLLISSGGSSAVQLTTWLFKKKAFIYSIIGFGPFYDFEITHETTSFSHYIPKEYIYFDCEDSQHSNYKIIDIHSTYLLIKNILLN